MLNCCLISLALWLGHCSAYNYSTFASAAFPPPSYTGIVNGAEFQKSVQETENRLQKLFEANSNTTSTIVLVRTAATETPIFSMAWNSASTPNVSITEDTIFRIGSVSKVFTVFALLMQEGFAHFDDLVTSHVPELRCASRTTEGCPSETEWDQITLGALAGQLAGIPRDYNAADLSALPLDWVAMGLPPLNTSEIPICSANETSSPCTRKRDTDERFGTEFLNGIKALPPVFQPHATPAYSNAAFQILAYAIESIAARPFEAIFDDLFRQQLQLTSTSLSTPSSQNGAVVPGDDSWTQKLGGQSASGGIYSSAHDLTAFASSILSNRLLLPQTTRRWLKPTSFTALMQLSIGMPWEIHRNPLPSTGHRIVDLYAKSGSIGVYASELILIPDYNVSIAVLTAGESGALVDAVTDIVLDVLLHALEQAAASEALQHFGGTYADTTSDSRLTLKYDGGPGLLVQSWISNSSDILQSADEYARSTEGGRLSSVRLFPADLSSATRSTFRCVFETTGMGQDRGIFRFNDGAWASVDQLVYGRGALDLFIFNLDQDGQATTVWNAGLRSSLMKLP